MPFISEEIWQQITHKGESITVAAWPIYNETYHDEVASKEMKQLVDIIKSIRNIRAEVDTPMSREIPILIKAQNKEIQASLRSEERRVGKESRWRWTTEQKRERGRSRGVDARKE